MDAAQEQSQGTPAVHVRNAPDQGDAASPLGQTAIETVKDIAPALTDPAQQIEVLEREADQRDAAVRRGHEDRICAALEPVKGVNQRSRNRSDVTADTDRVPSKRRGPPRSPFQPFAEGSPTLCDPKHVTLAAEHPAPGGPILRRCSDDEPGAGSACRVQPAHGENREELGGLLREKSLLARFTRWLACKENEGARHSAYLTSRSGGRIGLKQSLGRESGIDSVFPRHRFRSMNLTNSLRGSAPSTRSATWPFLKRMKVGIDVT